MNADNSPIPGEPPARLRVGVVGAGRVGPALAGALGRAGHEVSVVSAVSDASIRRIEQRLPGVAIRQPPEVVASADLVLMTVPDDVLPGLVAGLAATGAAVEGRLIAHASGRHGLGVLDPVVRAGALPLALHPVMTFTGRPDDIDRLAGISFGVTAPDPLRPVAEALVVEMGGEPVFIAEEQRDLYHAALASGANYLVTLVVQASDALRANAPEALPAYLALARLTADRAVAAGTLSAPDAQRLLGVLGGAPH